MKVGRVFAIVAALAVVLLPTTASASTGWQTVSSPSPGTNSYNELDSVSCTSANACTAVGRYEGTSRQLTLAERWNGTSWQVQSTPNPTRAVASILESVKCVSASNCMAVGWYEGSTGGDRMMAEHWNGSAWRLQLIANPTGISGTDLVAVACTKASNCMAVGEYTSGPSDDELLAEHWNGTSWKSQLISTPAGTAYGYLPAISCTSATACTAVGSDSSTTGGLAPLAEQWNGTNWKPQAVPGNSTLRSVKCNSATSCIAVGGSEFALWNGSTWTAQAVPGNGLLAGISCTSASACTAVGVSGDFSSLLAMYWNGSSWVNQTIPSPPGTATLGANLWAVSCTSATACAAVGRYFTSSTGAASTLVEQEQ